MSFQSFREKFNLLIYENKSFTLKALKFISLFVSLGMIGMLIYYYGFPITSFEKATINQLMKASFVFYIISFIIRFLYSFEPGQMLRDSWIEGILYSLIVIDAISYVIFDVKLIASLFEYVGVANFDNYYNLFLQLYLLIIVGLDIGSSTVKFDKTKINPAIIFLIVYISIIFSGAGLLMLPEMTVASKSLNFIDALFTSVSASCVTGLVIEDTALLFTFKGQMILLFLMKMGGINILLFGTFFALISKFGISVKQHEIIEDFVNKDNINQARGLITKILLISLFIELTGAIGLFISLPESPEISTIGDRLFFSIFHSISAFNNAGFSIYQNGFANEAVANAGFSHLVVCVLIFIGALGFTTILEVSSIKGQRDRLKYPWKKLSLASRIALKSSIHLTIFGFIIIALLEWDRIAFADLDSFGKSIAALFQSVTTRTAGFNTVNIGLLSTPTLIVFLFLMFIGGSSSSTAGGIKTSTFTLLFVAAWSTIRGKKNVEFFQRNISFALMEKAYTILLFALACLVVSLFFLSITESALLDSGQITIIDLIFEEVSAFSTVGLSTGVTPLLSDGGKSIIMLSMFIGRLGTLTLAFALSKRIISTKYKYPEAHLMIG